MSEQDQKESLKMSQENCVVDVEENSSASTHSSESEIDVEANDSSDMDSIEEGGSGEGMYVRKDHHNQLEKVRRKELGASFVSLKRSVKRLTGGRCGGRDKVLEIAHVILRRDLERFKRQRKKEKIIAEVLRDTIPTVADEHRAKLTELMNRFIKRSQEPYETEAGLEQSLREMEEEEEEEEEEEDSDEDTDEEDEDVDVDAIADLADIHDEDDDIFGCCSDEDGSSDKSTEEKPELQE